MKLARPAHTATLALAASFLAAVPALAQPDARKPAPAADRPSADFVTIKPHFKKADVLKYIYHLERTESTTVGDSTTGATPKLTVSMDAHVTATVTEATEAGATLEVLFGQVNAVGRPPMGDEFKFDSAAPEDDKDRENPVFQAFKPAVGMKYTLSVDAAGAVAEVNGELVAPQGSFGPVATQALANKDTMKFRWTNAFSANRGRGPIKPGEPWTQVDTAVARPVGQFEQSFTYRLKTATDGVASIDGVGEMKLLPLNEGDKLAFTLKDTSMLSTATWDLTDGLARAVEIQRGYTLAGDAQGHSITRIIQEKFSLTREK